MKGIKITDESLVDFFGDNEPFSFAENLEGEIYRKYENRTTKRFQNLQKNYFLKFHGPVGWAEIFKNLIQLKTPVVGALSEYEALSHLDKNQIQAPQIKGFGNKGLNPANSFSFLKPFSFKTLSLSTTTALFNEPPLAKPAFLIFSTNLYAKSHPYKGLWALVLEEDNVAVGALVKDKVDAVEQTLILSVQHIFASLGMAFSAGAVRDLPEQISETFDPKSAVSALDYAGFEASYGGMKCKNLRAAHCPAIGFLKSGEAVIVYSIDEDRTVHLRKFRGEDQFDEEHLQFKDLDVHLKPYFILARKVHTAFKTKGKNNWFWGSLLQGRWLYLQVIAAAAISNFLGLSTSLFIMVVYDRVVPNEAIESLIALTIGVLVVLGFDFIIKTLRAQFVDKHSIITKNGENIFFRFRRYPCPELFGF